MKKMGMESLQETEGLELERIRMYWQELLPVESVNAT